MQSWTLGFYLVSLENSFESDGIFGRIGTTKNSANFTVNGLSWSKNLKFAPSNQSKEKYGYELRTKYFLAVVTGELAKIDWSTKKNSA